LGCVSRACPTACRTSTCSGYAVTRGYCAICLKNNPAPPTSNYKFRVAKDPTKLLYDRMDWKGPRGTRALTLVMNPLCQHTHGGLQCRYPAKAVHHLHDPKDHPELMHSPANLVAVCANHHQGGQRGETQGYLYVPTKWYGGKEYPHIDQFGQLMLPHIGQPGERYAAFFGNAAKVIS